MTVNRRLGRWVAGQSVVVLLAACRGRPSRPVIRDRLLARQFRRQHQRLPAASGGCPRRVAVPRTGGWRAPRGSAPGAGGAGSGHPTGVVRRHPWRLDGRCHHELVLGRGDRNRRGQRPTGPRGDGRYRIHHQDGDRGRDHVPGTGRSDRPGHPATTCRAHPYCTGIPLCGNCSPTPAASRNTPPNLFSPRCSPILHEHGPPWRPWPLPPDRCPTQATR